MAGTITALRFQKRNAERVNVYLDDRYAFALPATVAVQLRRGQHLGDDDVARLQAIDQEEQAYDKCLRFLAYRPRSTAEVRRYLARRGCPESVTESIIERLQAADYLDDLAFARFWVSDRERFSPRGPLALRHELRQKGVAASIIAQVLEGAGGEDSAYQAALHRARRLPGLDARAFRQKLGNYLLRRGFSHDVVWPTVEQVWQEMVERSEEET
jgi:regulatory protein